VPERSTLLSLEQASWVQDTNENGEGLFSFQTQNGYLQITPLTLLFEASPAKSTPLEEPKAE
jgi:hypothetical protein